MSDDSNRGEAEEVARALRRVRVSRRLVLGGLLASAPGLAAADSRTPVAASRRAVLMANDPRLSVRPFLLPQKAISVIRPRDLLVLDFAFFDRCSRTVVSQLSAGGLSSLFAKLSAGFR